MQKKKIGFTIGKFAPLHKGHEFLIETALEEMDEFYVVIYDTDIIDINIKQRANWIKKLYPRVNIIYAYNSPKKYGLDEKSVKIQMEYLCKLIRNIEVTHFYSSELYGEKVSKYLNIENRLVDLSRKKVPISSTIIRNNLENNLEYMEDIVYRECKLNCECKFSNVKKLNRCKWCNLKNEKYVKYHDNEWCKPNFDDKYLFEMLILESFQAGLSWECVLNKREDFRKAFDNFDLDKICNYNNEKIQELLENEKIIRNKLKINATINNSKIFRKIQNEYGTFYNYLKTFTNGKIIYEIDKTTNDLSDMLSKDLQKRGMKFVGSTIIYSYLQAIGAIYSHDKECFFYMYR